MITWKLLEQNVKTISSFIWNCPATSETINGVKFDCVLKPSESHWIIVETTEEMTLDKVRTDIAKFGSCRHYLFSEDIFPEFFLVMNEEPTNSMVTTGQGAKIEVLSYVSFSKRFFDYPTYAFIRNSKIFGSSVNPLSGEPDKFKYTPVFYEELKTSKEIKIKDISNCLNEGKRIILLGNYGTGKSRCIRELFQILSSRTTNKILYPIAINLKEHWGTQRGEEIIRRHIGALGLSNMADSLVKILDSDRFIFLLDGFDEIGAQIWSDDSSKLKQIRASSLHAVKDLIINTKSPILITGREHYFNSESEMFEVLGLDKSETKILKCKDEFSEEEMKNYLMNISLTIDLPIWLPRRPLICQIINTISTSELESIFIDTQSAIDFWNTLIENMCKREARISPALHHATVYKILIKIASFTRTKKNDTGPITIREINKAFEKVVGTAPVDESAVMLQRLPALSRITSESTDRQFIDYYILDGLRADHLIELVYTSDTSILDQNWINPLQKTGIEIVARKMSIDKSANTFIDYLKKAIYKNVNRIIIGDIFACLVEYGHKIDLDGIILANTNISFLNFSNCLIDNVLIKDSIINNIDISNYSFTKITFKECLINKIYGISSFKEIPPFIIDSEIEIFESDTLNKSDRRFNIKPSQMILISLIRKIFILNIEKTEYELCSSYGNREDKELVSAILKILVKEKIIAQSHDNNRYKAKTYNRKRVLQLLNDLSKSKDPLWDKIGNLN